MANKNGSSYRERWLSAPLSAANPTWITLELNPALCYEKPAASPSGYDAVFMLKELMDLNCNLHFAEYSRCLFALLQDSL
jgi:hypothetical protein